ALSLGLTLLAVAGLLFLLEAEFVGWAQILVYVGAILTLVVFAIMLTARAKPPPASQAPRRHLPAVVVSTALFGLLLTVVNAMPSSMVPDAVRLEDLGRELVTTLALPFEVIGVLFVAAMVGAVVVAVSKAPGRAPTGSHLKPE
ncbi:MAG: NADH-quinone oxidoreductase subunit J, partial [Candidatus Omnitrophica bacterium]|nr:NADH-quinone oxidoreductase subunit J [Candidatus Omnitrophota bacterium]